MDVTTTTGTAAGQTTGQTTQPQTATAISSDFQTFLKMLTTQVQNQDPLNPIDSTDFAVQLATFSGVEQQVRTNDLLAQMIAASGAAGLGQYAGWVGQTARAEAAATFDGIPVALHIAPAAGADSAELIVRNASGTVVQRTQVPLSGGRMEWAGTSASGQPMPSGAYRFDLESRAGGEVLALDPVEIYARITEVRIEDGAPRIVLAGGATVAPEAITALGVQESGE